LTEGLIVRGPHLVADRLIKALHRGSGRLPMVRMPLPVAKERGYRSHVQPTLDEATSRFLETAQADLQRHLGSAGTVAAVMIDRLDNIVAAYAALTRSHAAPERTLPSQLTKR
jgi:hypothetical protein